MHFLITVNPIFILILLFNDINYFIHSSSATEVTTPANKTEKINLYSYIKDRPLPVVLKGPEKSTATLIFLHDYTENGELLCSEQLEHYRAQYMKIVCPNSLVYPTTVHLNRRLTSWFDFGDRSYPQSGKNRSHIKDSMAYIHRILDEEIKHGTTPERIMIGGIAQGATMALHAALSYPRKLAGVVMYSPFQPDEKLVNETMLPSNKNIPVFQCHNIEDVYTENASSRNITKYLKEHITNDVDYFEHNYRTAKYKYEQLRRFYQMHIGPL